MVAWCLRRALLSGLTRRWQPGTSIVGSCWIQWFFLKVITLNPVITITPAKITRLAIHKRSVPFVPGVMILKERSFPVVGTSAEDKEHPYSDLNGSIMV